MKIRFIIIILATVIAATMGYGQVVSFEGLSDNHTATRNYQASNGFYVIEFNFNVLHCTIPSTYPAGQPHYDAKITVYQIVDGKRIKVGDTFDGQYTFKGCFEDEPSSLVAKAKEIAQTTIYKWEFSSVTNIVMTITNVPCENGLAHTNAAAYVFTGDQSIIRKLERTESLLKEIQEKLRDLECKMERR